MRIAGLVSAAFGAFALSPVYVANSTNQVLTMQYKLCHMKAYENFICDPMLSLKVPAGATGVVLPGVANMDPTNWLNQVNLVSVGLSNGTIQDMPKFCLFKIGETGQRNLEFYSDGGEIKYNAKYS
jgi:hypothetical protein